MSYTQRVHDVMLREFKVVEGVTKISDALVMMRDKNLHAILIKPRDETDVYGILSLRDIARRVIAERRKLHETHVYEIMSKPVLSVQGGMPVAYAARLLSNFDVSYAMVMENNAVVGMVSLHGIVTKWEME